MNIWKVTFTDDFCANTSPELLEKSEKVKNKIENSEHHLGSRYLGTKYFFYILEHNRLILADIDERNKKVTFKQIREYF